MKLLYLSHAFENSGFSTAAHNYIKALLTVGVDVVSRHIKLNNSVGIVPDFINECEAKSLDGCTHVIQHVLPHHLSYVPNLRNIAICVYDLSSLRYCEWDRQLNCMDEVWIPNIYTEFQKEIITKISYIPHACNSDVFKKTYEPLNIKELGGTCVFYTIADLNMRKNIRDFFLAFYSEFHSNEPVSIMIKTSKFGLSPEESAEAVMNSVADIKKDMKLYPKVGDYTREVIITNRLTDDEMYQIHQSGFCYVNTSHGEGFLLPQFDAWALGNRVIFYATQQQDYCYLRQLGNDYHSVTVGQTPCFNYNDTFPNLGTSRENWANSDISALRIAMRKVYNEWKVNPNKLPQPNYEKYSYESIGNIMKEALSGKTN